MRSVRTPDNDRYEGRKVIAALFAVAVTAALLLVAVCIADAMHEWRWWETRHAKRDAVLRARYDR